jgi:hypothetical protein
VGLKVMLALGAAHAVTSCAHEVTALTATMEVEALALVYTATPGAGNKVKKTKRSLRPVNLLNRLLIPNAHTVLTPNDVLIEIRATMYRRSQQKDSGGGGGGGGLFEWYAGVVGIVVHVQVTVQNNSGPFPCMFARASFLVATIQMRDCSGVSLHHFLGFASFFGILLWPFPSVRSLFIKFSVSDVSASWPAGWIISLRMRTDSSSAEQIFRVGSA